MQLLNVIEEFPSELQKPVLHLAAVLREERGVSHEDFSDLKAVVQDLAAAQKELTVAQQRTEQRVEELAAAQQRTEKSVEELTRSMQAGFKEIRDSIAALGSRWGIQNEATVRNTLKGVLGETNYSVERAYYGNREVDIVIRGDGAHILLEVTAALKTSDIEKYIASADDYEAKNGVSPVIMIAAPHIPPGAVLAIRKSARRIDLYSADE